MQQPGGQQLKHAVWRLTPLGFLVLFLCTSCGRTQAPLVLAVLADQYHWYFRHPGPNERLGDHDDVISKGSVTVPQDRRLHLHISSTDYLYTFRLPELEQKQMAVPELTFTLEFASGKPAVYPLRGDQMCGFAHESLLIDFEVASSNNYRAFLSHQQQAAHTWPSEEFP